MFKVQRFERVVWVALLLELLERLAFYGVYVNLQVYLGETVRISDVEIGLLLGTFSLVRSWVPIAVGAAANRIGFKRSLSISFGLYAVAYAMLYLAPSRVGAWGSVLGIGVAGAFLKPVVPGTVRRYTPPEDRTAGFSYFYASVNAGSVVGKVLARNIRAIFSLRSSILNALAASAIGLAVTIGYYKEPAPKETTNEAGEVQTQTPSNPLRDVAGAFKQTELMVFLLLITGYYLLIEQFYQTFPTYIVRTLGEKAPREYLTLLNPAAIAIFGVFVGKLTKNLPPTFSMALGGLIGAISMFVMGASPTLVGMGLSFLIFAFAEMVFSPRYYEYVSSFAPPGREALYMGFAIAPLGLGGLAGGVLSGRLVEAYLPKGGPLQPLKVWGTYAVIGVLCAVMIATFGLVVRRLKARRSPGAANV